MAQFATADDLASYLNRSFTPEQADRADFILRLASAAVQSYTRQQLELVEDDVVTLRGSWTDELDLPQRPVTGVSAVSVNLMPLSGFRFDPSGRLFFGPQPWAVNGPDLAGEGFFGGEDGGVVVTYSHGYDPIPDAIILATMRIATRLLDRPDTGGQPLQSESIGDYSYALADTVAFSIAAGLTADERALLDPYRRVVASIRT